MTHLDDALRAASRGWAVFPLLPGKKVPATQNGQNNATTDAGQIRAWWGVSPNANYGVHCAPSGLYVVDVDNANGKKGEATWAALTAEHGHVPTFTVRTQSGGLHFYYQMPEGEALTNTAGKIGPNVDTRGNGYVVGPGSVVGGNGYTVEHDLPVAPLPAWVVEAVKNRPVAQPARHIGDPLGVLSAPPSDVMAQVQRLADELAAAPDGTGNNTAASVAYKAGQYVGAGQISHHEAQAVLEAAIAGWAYQSSADHQAMLRTIDNQLTEGAKVPRVWEAARFPERAVDAVDATQTANPDTDEKPTDWSTDAGQSRWILATARDLIHVEGIGFLKWDGTRWVPVGEEQVKKGVLAFYRAAFDRYAEKFVRSTGDAKEKAGAFAGFMKERMSSKNIRNVMYAIKADATLTGPNPAALLDAHSHLLNTPTGVVDLRNGDVLPHTDPRAPMLYMTKVTKGSYRPELKHPDWEAALGALPEDAARWLQLRMGAAISGRQMADDAVFLYGGGSNGKSLFCNDGIVRALGDYGLMKSSELIASRKADQSAATPEKAELRGARFVLIEELPEGFSLNTKAVKELSGTGQINARKLYHDSITFDATHSLFVNTNHVPNVTETDWGTWRRLSMVHFPFTFTSRPSGPSERKGDRGLVDRFRYNTTGQWDAMVTWLVQGAMDVLTDQGAITIGMREADDGRAPSVKAATRAWRGNTDRVMAYVEEFIVADLNGCIAKSDLLWHFNRWLESQGQGKWSARLLSDRLRNHPSLPSEVRVERSPNGRVITRPPADLEEQFSNVLPPFPRRPELFVGIRYIDGTTDNLE